MSAQRPTREECIARAGQALATAYERIERMTPREQAEAAYTPGGKSVDELEAQIRRKRGLPETRAS